MPLYLLITPKIPAQKDIFTAKKLNLLTLINIHVDEILWFREFSFVSEKEIHAKRILRLPVHYVNLKSLSKKLSSR